MICPHAMKDAMGLWICGAHGRICTKKHDPAIECDMKPNTRRARSRVAEQESS